MALVPREQRRQRIRGLVPRLSWCAVNRSPSDVLDALVQSGQERGAAVAVVRTLGFQVEDENGRVELPSRWPAYQDPDAQEKQTDEDRKVLPRVAWHVPGSAFVRSRRRAGLARRLPIHLPRRVCDDCDDPPIAGRLRASPASAGAPSGHRKAFLARLLHQVQAGRRTKALTTTNGCEPRS